MSLKTAQIRDSAAWRSIFSRNSKSLFGSVIILENSLDSLFEGGLLESVTLDVTLDDGCHTDIELHLKYGGEGHLVLIIFRSF